MQRRVAYELMKPGPSSSFSVHAIYMRCDRLVIHTFGVECIALSMFWMMWFVGTAIATVSSLLNL